MPGGCDGGQPRLGPAEPGIFEGEATQGEIAVRDQLIADQEALLNTYRCKFSIDTHIVPGGCGRKAPRSFEDELAFLTVSEMNRLRGGNHPMLELDEGLSRIAQAHARAQAEADDWLPHYAPTHDLWALLEPGWDFWSIGDSASTPGDLNDLGLARALSTALLGEDGARIRPCPLCTHLATGVATVNGNTYATTVMAGRDSGRRLSEQEMASAEAELRGSVNELRASVGLHPLMQDAGITSAARRWSQIMGAETNFNHNPYAGADYPQGYSFQGENIAAARLYGSLTVSDIVNLTIGDWINSPFHYSTMVNSDATHVGVGIVLKNGWIWTTLNLASHSQSRIN